MVSTQKVAGGVTSQQGQEVTELVAEKIIKQAAAPPPKIEASVAKALDNAERTVKEARSAASEIDAKLPQARPGQPQELPKREETISNLEGLVAKMKEMGTQKTGNEELDRKISEFIGPAVAQLEDSIAKLKAGKGETLSPADTEKLRASVGQVQQKTELVSKIVVSAKELTERGAPPELVKAVGAAIELYNRGEPERAKMLTDTIPTEFKARSDAFLSQEGAPSLQQFMAAVAKLADVSTKMSNKDVEANKTELVKSIESVNVVRVKRLELVRQAIQFESVLMKRMLSQETNQAMRAQLTCTLEDMQDMAGAIESGNADPAAIQGMASRIMAALDTSRMVRDAPPGIKNQLASVCAAALKFLDRGGKQQGYETMKTAAQELGKNAGDSPLEKKYRSDIMGAVDGLAKAEEKTSDANDAQHQAALGALSSKMSQRYADGLREEARKADPKTAPVLEGMGKDIMKDPEHVSPDLLARAKMALELAGRIRSSKPEIATINKRALDALSGGRSIDEALVQANLAQLAGRQGIGPQAAELESMSASLAKDPGRLGAAIQYLQIDNSLTRLAGLKAAQKGNEPALKAIGLTLKRLEEARGSLSRGERIAGGDSASDSYFRGMLRMNSDPEFAKEVKEEAAALRKQKPDLSEGEAQSQVMVRVGWQAAEAAESKKIDSLLSAADTFAGALEKSGASQKRKEDVGRLFSYSVTSYLEGHAEDGAAFRDAATAYVNSPSDRERADILALCKTAGDTAAEGSQRHFSQDQLRLLVVYQQRSRYESQVTDPKTAQNVRAYFDLATIAAKGQNDEQFQTVLDMAVLYAGMAAMPASEKRTKAMEFVQANLGDFSKSKAGSKRLLDVAPTEIPKEAAGISSALLGGRPAYEALGKDAAEGAAKMVALGKETNAHMMDLDEMQFGKRSSDVIGGKKEQTRADAAYKQEAARLQGESAAARKRKDDTLSGYYGEQSKLTDRAFVTGAVATADEIYKDGRRETELGMGMMDEAGNVSNADAAKTQARINELAADMGGQSKEILGKALARADGDPRELRASLDAMVAQMPEALRPAYEERLKQAGADSKGVRAMYLELVCMQALAVDGRIHMQNGTELQGRASRIVDNAGQLDTSIRKIDTQQRENGRFELRVAISTDIAIAKGKEVDLLGNPVAGEQKGKLAPEQLGLLEAQAEASSRIGKVAVAEQRQVQEERNQGVAQSQRDVRDANIRQGENLIDRMLGKLKPDEQESYRKALEEANTKKAGETEIDFRKRQAGAINTIYKELGDKTGIQTTRTTGDGKEVLIFDAERGYGDYRNVVNLWYAEKFPVARSASGLAQYRISSSSARAGNRINQWERKNEWDAATGGANSEFMKGLGIFRNISAESFSTGKPIGNAGGIEVNIPPSGEVLDEIISHLPADQRAVAKARLRAIPKGEDGNGKRRDLFVDLADKTVPVGKEGRTVPLMMLAGSMSYYDADAFDRELDRTDGKAAKGDLRGASAGLNGIISDMGVAYYQQGRDAERMRDMRLAWRRRSDAELVPKEYFENAPAPTADHPKETAREKGTREDRNGALADVTGYLKDSMIRSADDLDKAADANEGARDEVGRTRKAFSVNAGFLKDMVEELPSDTQERYRDQINRFAESQQSQDASVRDKGVAEFYGFMSGRGEDFNSAMTSLSQEARVPGPEGPDTGRRDRHYDEEQGPAEDRGLELRQDDAQRSHSAAQAGRPGADRQG